MKKRTFPAGTGIFGEGRPKVCVPIVEETQEAVWKKAEEIAALPADIAEWRADFYQDIFRMEAVSETLKGLKRRLGDKALLFTFRTGGEGGNRTVDTGTYDRLNELAAREGADLVDVEIYLEEASAGARIRKLQEAGCHVIASNHDFHGTPPPEEMVRRLMFMQEQGADAAKLAVMPRGRQDVLNLLQATLTADERLAIPVVTMSMGELGVVSRLSGRLTGSAMTFAALGKTSAPGQIPVSEIDRFLDFL